jgi:hypothetical protein|nr:MAG TPA: Rz lysis protein [Caudoviricetes sp.]
MSAEQTNVAERVAGAFTVHLLDPRLWLFLIMLGGIAYAAGDYRGAKVAALASAARESKANQVAAEHLAGATERVRELELFLGRQYDELTAANQKVEKNAKTEIDRLRGDLRSGDVRLSVAVASCGGNTAGTDSAAGDQETRAELLPATAERILDIGADANSTVRELNLCVDKYEVLRRKLNGATPQQ